MATEDEKLRQHLSNIQQGQINALKDRRLQFAQIGNRKEAEEGDPDNNFQMAWQTTKTIRRIESEEIK